MGVRGYLSPRNSRLGNSRIPKKIFYFKNSRNSGLGNSRNSSLRNSRIPKKIFYFSTLKTLGILEFFLVLFSLFKLFFLVKNLMKS